MKPKSTKNKIPTYKASRWTEKQTEKAMRDYDKAIVVKDLKKFFKDL